MPALGLPDEGYQPVLHLLHVFFISLKISFQDLFLVKDPFHYDRYVREHYYKGYDRAQHQRHRKEQKDGRHIHRMTHDPVKTGIDDLLIVLDFDRAGKISILPQYLCVKRVCSQEDQRKNDADSKRKHQQTEPVTQAR